MNPTHRIALEARSSHGSVIWLLFYEILHYLEFYAKNGYYKQQMLRIFKDFNTAEKAALFVISDRKIEAPLIIRDAKHKHEKLRA